MADVDMCRVLCRAVVMGLFSVVALLAQAPAASAGNLDSYYMSGEAMLQGGAITASAQGGGAIWYNPAGLAEISGLRLDVSVSSFALRLGGPSSVTLTHRVGDVGVGFGVFVPTQETVFWRTQIEGPGTEPGSRVGLGLDVYGRLQDYFGGPSLSVPQRARERRLARRPTGSWA